MDIPVYGLSGISQHIRREPSAAFLNYARKIKNAKLRKHITDKHKAKLDGIEGIFNTSAAKIAHGKATNNDVANFKKAKIMLTLEGYDYDAFRLAEIYMPYVLDIDEKDGGYYFPSQELAEVTANGENEFINYCKNLNCSELGKIKLFKKIGNAVKKAAQTTVKAVTTAAKATATATKAAVQSTVNATKATANLVKAGVQAATGNTTAAKETLNKAGQQAKAAITEPVKTAVQVTKEIAKDTVVNPVKTLVVDPLKTIIQIAGKVFKVLFIKINPVTVLIRSSLRGLISLNFLGMATRLNVGLLTEQQAAEAGYDKTKWEAAKKAVEKLKKLFTKMGGKADKLEQSIRNGAKHKALFKKDVKATQKINFANGDDGETTLGEPATIATMIATCITILTTIWGWIKSIVAEKQQKKEQEQQKKEEEEKKKQYAELYEVDINGNPILDEYGRPIPKGTIDADNKQAQAEQAVMAIQATKNSQDEEKKKKKRNIILIAVAVGTGLFFLMGSKKNKRRK